MCSKVLNGHIILTDTSITTILAPEMTYTPKVFGTLVFVVRHVVYFDTSHISTPFPVTSAFETVMDFPV